MENPSEIKPPLVSKNIFMSYVFDSSIFLFFNASAANSTFEMISDVSNTLLIRTSTVFLLNIENETLRSQILL